MTKPIVAFRKLANAPKNNLPVSTIYVACIYIYMYIYIYIYIYIYFTFITDIPHSCSKITNENHTQHQVLSLYGEVISVKNTTINIWLNDGVCQQWKKLHVSAYSVHLQVLTIFLLKEFYKTLLAKRLSKLDVGRYRPKHIVFLLLINTIIQPYIYSCVFDRIHLNIEFKHTAGMAHLRIRFYQFYSRLHVSAVIASLYKESSDDRHNKKYILH